MPKMLSQTSFRHQGRNFSELSILRSKVNQSVFYPANDGILFTLIFIESVGNTVGNDFFRIKKGFKFFT